MPEAGRRRASPAVGRARRLLVAGLGGGHAAAAVAVLGLWLARGTAAGVSAALAAGATIVFYTIGLAVQIVVADATPKRVLGASLASYLLRVSGFGVGLGVALANADAIAWLDAVAVVVATIATVIGWLSAEMWAHARLRIPVYDVCEEVAEDGHSA